MKVAALASLIVLIALPAEAGQRHRQNASPVATCDNDGHCTTFNASAPVPRLRGSRLKIHDKTIDAAATPPGPGTVTAATPAAAPGTAIAMATPTPATSGAATDTTTLAASDTATTPTTTDVAVPDTVIPTEPASVPLPKPRAAALGANGNAAGIIISSKTGVRTRVGVAYAARFQAYIDDLEKNYGARILFMGGLRPGRCSIFGEHPCGKALDVCQLRRGVVDPRCNLPGRVTLGRIAASHGLFEGGRWCDSDYGHAQVDVTAPACGDPPLLMVRQMEPRR
jgi:hypothetical protein